ncbi:hypothetical protein HGA88_04575 [Candidatus Roizmanbacteria bacterium]|nr:hypothetical protein [Candidatus Roizmanbacteria bacterium]
MSKLLVVYSVVLTAVVIAGGAYYFGTHHNTLSPVTSQPTSPTGLYSPTAMVLPTELPSPQPTLPDSDDKIKADIKTALVAKHGASANSLVISVSKRQGDYATGGAKEEVGGGGMWLGAKRNGVWQLVWDGNGIMECSAFTSYPDFPTAYAPECWDVKADKLVKR